MGFGAAFIKRLAVCIVKYIKIKASGYRHDQCYIKGIFTVIVNDTAKQNNIRVTYKTGDINWRPKGTSYVYQTRFHSVQIFICSRLFSLRFDFSRHRVPVVENCAKFLYLQYIPRNMHTVFALLCFVVVIHWLIFPYPSGLLHWHCGNLTIAPVPAKQPWWIWINTSCEFIMKDCITTTKQSTTKRCAYFLGYTVHVHTDSLLISIRNTEQFVVVLRVVLSSLVR